LLSREERRRGDDWETEDIGLMMIELGLRSEMVQLAGKNSDGFKFERKNITVYL
jgi:hypothetical protein